jgi:uncharacterized membrane protein YfcA
MSVKSRGVGLDYLLTAALLFVIGGLAAWHLSSDTAGRGTVVPVGLPAIVLLAAVGLLAGLLGGLIGTGGCSVMLPVIHFWMGYPAPIAIGTTLFTATSGACGHLVRRNVDLRATLWLGGTGILGVILGSWLFVLLAANVALLGLILGLAFLWPAIRMIWEGVARRKRPEQEGAIISGSRWGWAVLGFLIGVLTGLVGLGGGYALVPGLIYLFGAPVYLTMGTSLAVMIPLAVVGGGIKLAQGFVALRSGLLLAAGTVVGAQVGAAVIKRFRPTTLKLVFGLYFLYVSLKFIAGYFGLSIW